MKRAPLLLLSAAAIAGWCSTGFAQQTVTGAIPTPLSPSGVTGGVAMTGQAGGGTLTVGVVGGPELDIFTNNSSGGIVTNPALQAVSTDRSSLSNIVFNSSSTVFGAIGVTQPGGPFFLNLTGGNTGTAVNFDGNVYATTLNVTGTGAVNFNSGSTNITATNFAADGTINLAPNTTVIGALTTTAGANTGTLVLGSGSVLNGAVGGGIGIRAINVVGGSNTAGVSASISGAVNAYTFNLGTNTLNIGGALTIANGTASGVVNTTLASPTVYGNIRPVGATNLGPTLAVNVTVPSTAVIPVGTQFNLVQTQTGTVQSGTNGSVLNITVQDPTNPLYTFSAVPPAGTVAGLVAITTTGIPLTVPIAPPPGVPLPPTTPIAAPVVPVLVAVIPTAASLVAPINALTDAATVVNALAQLAPSAADLAASQVTFQVAHQFQDLVLSHLDAVMCDQVNQLEAQPGQPGGPTPTCRDNDPRGGWWVKGFGYFGNQGAENAFLGYDTGIYGTIVGYDAPLDPGTRVGLGIGYARSTIDGKTFVANTDSNTYQATAYVSHEEGPWFVQGDASLGWNDYSGMRNVSFPGFNASANANYSGQSYTGFLTAGYHFFTQDFTLTPLASLQYTHLNLDNYTETGGGLIDLNVGSQSYDFLESGLGGKVAHPFAYGNGSLVPEIHVKWLHEIVNPTTKNTASFAVAGSPSFTTPGYKAGADTADLGVGVTFLSCGCTAKTWSLEAVYDHYWRTDSYSADQGMIKATVRF